MPLVPQQDVLVVIIGALAFPGRFPAEVAIEELKARLEDYPPCRIVSLTSAWAGTSQYTLTAVVETI
jgi:hypothetical protein